MPSAQLDPTPLRKWALRAGAHASEVHTRVGLKDVPSWRDHSVVQQHGLAGVVPFGLFMDGAWGSLGLHAI